MSKNISNEQLAVMIEETNKNVGKMLVALYGDEDTEEKGLIKDVRELKEIVTTSKTLWEAVKTIGKWVIGLSMFTAASMYFKHLVGDLTPSK